MLLSILIPTLEKRNDKFMALYINFCRQVVNLKLDNDIEILYHQNNGEVNIGNIRNMLIARSKAKYIVFFDDDDTPHKKYIETLTTALKGGPDVVSFDGEVNFNGQGKRDMIFRLRYKSFSGADNTFTRPPTHLCPMKRSLVKNFLFNDDVKGSDVKWAMAISDAGVLKKEFVIEEKLYFYNYDSTKDK